MTGPLEMTDREKLAVILFETWSDGHARNVADTWTEVADTVIGMIGLAEEIGFNRGVKAALGIDLE